MQPFEAPAAARLLPAMSCESTRKRPAEQISKSDLVTFNAPLGFILFDEVPCMAGVLQ